VKLFTHATEMNVTKEDILPRNCAFTEIVLLLAGNTSEHKAKANHCKINIIYDYMTWAQIL
jgi:hypothetical protein